MIGEMPFDFREEMVIGEVGGRQVARVKKSTSLRMKKRGKVPPRLLTLSREKKRVSLVFCMCCARCEKQMMMMMIDENETYVARSVIYVPPITGSAIFA